MGAVALSVAVRLPFVGAPLTSDEGGYAEVARLWKRGWTLYGDAWVDRPQGLVLAFRAVLSAAGSPDSLRVAAMAIGAVVALQLLWLGWRMGGTIVGAGAALLYATAGSSPRIEGFTLAGELIASVPAVAAVGCGWFALEPSRSRRAESALLVSAGLLGGLALTVKQSAFDGAAAVLIAAALASRPGRIRRCALVAGAAVIPLVLSLAAAPSSRAWWDAVVAYRGQGDSIVTGEPFDRLQQFLDTAPAAGAALGIVLLLATLGWRQAPTLGRLWTATAAVGVLGGGNFHTHYYLQLAPPLCLLGGFGIRELRQRSAARAVTAGALVAVVVGATALPLALMTPADQARRIWPADPHLVSDSAVALAVAKLTGPAEKVQVLWGAAPVYYLADRAPAVRYMWRRPIESVPGAVADLRRRLELAEPAVVVLAQPLEASPAGASIAGALARRYRLVTVVDGVPILGRRNGVSGGGGNSVRLAG